MVTREISDEIPADRAVLRHIVRDLDQNLGVYATIVTPGVVRVGDADDGSSEPVERDRSRQRGVATPHEWYDATLAPGR